MADKTMNTLKVIGAILGIVVVVATPITAITLATYTGNAAQKDAGRAIAIAEEAKKIGQDNAKDFEYFKGKLEGTIKGVEKGMITLSQNHKDADEKMDKKVDKMELKIDEVLKIMVRFKRADLDGE